MKSANLLFPLLIQNASANVELANLESNPGRKKFRNNWVQHRQHVEKETEKRRAKKKFAKKWKKK